MNTGVCGFRGLLTSKHRSLVALERTQHGIWDQVFLCQDEEVRWDINPLCHEGAFRETSRPSPRVREILGVSRAALISFDVEICQDKESHEAGEGNIKRKT